MSAEGSDSHADPTHSDEEMERLALAAAEAIKCLIAERKVLRQEVARLREHVALIRNSYRKLANELIAQLQLVDSLEQNKPGTDGLLQLPQFLGRDSQKAR